MKLIVLGFLSAAILVITVLICNFISFSVRINGHDSLLSFGPRGFWEFLILFPWLLLILDGVLIFTLEWLLRKFQFGYRSPGLYLLLGLLTLSVSLGLVLDRGTPVNDHFLNRAQHHGLPPPFQDFYRGARQLPPPDSGTCKCVITNIEGNIITGEEVGFGKTQRYTIIIHPNDPILNKLKVGDTIFVFGDIASSTIRAFGVRPL